MNQVQEGLFAVEEQMPCSPKDITLGYYDLPLTLGRVDQEEAVARILSFSQQLDQWVGVSWIRLHEMMVKDLQACWSIDVQRTMRRYYILCALTLGVYALFVAKPWAHMREVPEVPDAKLPTSGIFVLGSKYVFRVVDELVERGFLRLVIKGAIEVYFPTPVLVSHIMQKQGVAVKPVP
jgi:hypothetical protein